MGLASDPQRQLRVPDVDETSQWPGYFLFAGIVRKTRSQRGLETPKPPS
jgi:hypothetical protein